MERLAELAQIGAFKENIEGILGMLNISGLGGSSPSKSGLIGEDGQDKGAFGDRSNFGDTAGRRGPGAGPDYSNVASDLLGRVSEGLGSGEKMGGGVASPGSPSDALGGIASRRTGAIPRRSGVHLVGREVGEWEDRTESNARGRTTVEYYSDGSTIEERETRYASGAASFSRVLRDKDGNTKDHTYNYYQNYDSFHGKGSGDTGKPDSGDTGKPKDIAKLQDPYSGGGVVVWISPNCGSAECNRMRKLLKDPGGALLQQSRDKMGKVSRPDRDGGGTGTTQRLVIDQHGLVVSYGADSGPAGSGGGRVHRFKSRQDQVQ
jgi:hypothetical protein